MRPAGNKRTAYLYITLFRHIRIHGIVVDMAEYIGILAFLSLLMAGSCFFQWAVQDITQIVIIHLAVKPQYFLSIPEYDYDRDTS